MTSKETETQLQSTRLKAVSLKWLEIFIFKRKINNIRLFIIFKIFDQKVFGFIDSKSKIS